MLFDPAAASDKEARKAEKAAKKKILAQLKEWSMDHIPIGELREGACRNTRGCGGC